MLTKFKNVTFGIACMILKKYLGVGGAWGKRIEITWKSSGFGQKDTFFILIYLFL